MHQAEYPYIFRQNMQIYLQDLSNEIVRSLGPVSIDLLLAGGSAVILNHTFRDCTEDIDAYTDSKIDLTPYIKRVSERFSITEDWMNFDFSKSKSFSKGIIYNAINRGTVGCLSIYTVCDLDLICMKLVSFRIKDMTDLNGLLTDNPQVTQEDIQERLTFLYGVGSVYNLSKGAKEYVRGYIKRR